jgi:hypothetical protein
VSHAPEGEGVAYKEHLDCAVYFSLISSKGIKFSLTKCAGVAEKKIKNLHTRQSDPANVV